jgi:lysophospholipase L1-like esterase
MPALFRRALPDDPSSAWGFGDAQPDAVVIHLGTNDFDPGDPGPAFGRAYVTFLEEVRGRYPLAYLVCALSPMLSDSDPPGAMRRTAAAAAIRSAVHARTAAGDARVAFLAFDEQSPGDGFGCESHPSVKTHRVMANKLSAALRELLRW